MAQSFVELLDSLSLADVVSRCNESDIPRQDEPKRDDVASAHAVADKDIAADLAALMAEIEQRITSGNEKVSRKHKTAVWHIDKAVKVLRA